MRYTLYEMWEWGEQKYELHSVPGPVLVALGTLTPYTWGIPGI